MTQSDEIDYHFIDLKGAITGKDQLPASVSEHRSLSINRAAVMRLLSGRHDGAVGAPLPSRTPASTASVDGPRGQLQRIDTSALGVDYSLPTAAPQQKAPSVNRPDEQPRETDPQPLVELRPVPEEVTSLPFASATSEPENSSNGSDSPPASAPETSPSAAAVPSELPRTPVPQGPVESHPAAEAIQPQPVSNERELEAAPPAPVPEEHAPEAGADPAPLQTGDIIKLRQELDQRSEPADDEEPGREQYLDEAHPAVAGAQPEQRLESASGPAGSDTDRVLFDVQSTLNSLADMAKGLNQQKLEASKLQDGLEQRKALLNDRERQLTDKEEQLRQLEARLDREAASLERSAEEDARALAERSQALKTLAENIEARDRNLAKQAESLRLEKQRSDELAELLQKRAVALDEREASLNRQCDELAEKLKQLISAKDRFRSIVKAFNETVQFNDTLNAISSTVADESHR